MCYIINSANVPFAVSRLLLDLSVQSRDSQKVARDHSVSVSSFSMFVFGHSSRHFHCAAMWSDGFRSRRLVEAVIQDVNFGWAKPSKRQGYQKVVTSGNVKLVFRSSQSAAEDLTVLDVMRPAGSGAFKDVFFLDKSPFVVKLMLRSRNNPQAWSQGSAEEEQKRFDRYREQMEDLMTFCYGQLYLRSETGDGLMGGRPIFGGGDVTRAEAEASITVQERLMAVGQDKMRLLFSKQGCDRDTWSEVIREYMGMLEVLFKVMRRGILPWDAKLDNLGIARRGMEGKWVMCDLDGLRTVGEEKNYGTLGKAMRMICSNLVSADRHFIQDLSKKQIMRDGWQQQFDKVLNLVSNLLANSEVAQPYAGHQKLLEL